MARTEYWVSLGGQNQSETQEKIIRKFLLANSDRARLTEINWTELGFFKIKRFGGEKDNKFIETLERLKPFFLEKTTNNKRFNDVGQGKNSEFNHYYYRLSPKIKSLINEETLLCNLTPYYYKNFYGFEDPTFYKNDAMIGSVITHERTIILYLAKSEKQKLEKQGIELQKAAADS